MERKYRLPKSSEKIGILGNNFIVETIYNNFKRYSQYKIQQYNNINDIKGNINFLIDCSFNIDNQNESIGYSIKNNITKLIIVNHWSRNLPTNTIKIIQLVIPDVYGNNHESFNRSGVGNNDEYDINYCSLICETIRRVHESKIGGVPYTYINYGDNKIKYLYVDNIYQPLEKIIKEKDECGVYEIYDEEKSPGYILNIIKEIIEYDGDIVFNNTKENYNKNYKRLITQNNKKLDNELRRIYKNLLFNNDRFKIF